jgi:hypothetical protein
LYNPFKKPGQGLFAVSIRRADGIDLVEAEWTTRRPVYHSDFRQGKINLDRGKQVVKVTITAKQVLTPLATEITSLK